MTPQVIGPFPGMRGHRAESLMIRCMDFRFQEAFSKFLETRNFAGCDVVGIAGGVMDWQQVEKHIDIAVELHEVGTVVLVNHRHCGAYGKELQADPDAEIQKHKEDLLTTAQRIKKKYPHLVVETWFAEMEPKNESSEITFLRVG